MPQAALPLTYPDLLFVDDLDPFGQETTSDLQNLAQDVYHLLLELTASNADDETRGVGLSAMLSGTEDQLAAAPKIIDSQLRKDARVLTSTSVLTTQSDGSYLLQISIQPAGGLLPIPLTFTYSASQGLVPLGG
jgi:hypothetical protein